MSEAKIKFMKPKTIARILSTVVLGLVFALVAYRFESSRG
jgi:hypothetical protein